MTRNYIRTTEHRRKLGESIKQAWQQPEVKAKILGSNNSQWKGDQVKYYSLHEWIKNHKPQTNKCESCDKETSQLDLANISGLYKRSLDDFEWLCRRCHMLSDGRMKNLKRGGGVQDPKTGRFIRRDN